MNSYINICVCITPGADISDDRIAKDLAVAESIWHPITFQIKEVIVLNELFRFSNREISYKNSIQSQEKLSSFFKLVLTKHLNVTFIFVILAVIISKKPQ